MNQQYLLFYPTLLLSFPDLDVGDAWELDSDDGELSCYGDEPGQAELDRDAGETVTVKVDRKTSTGSTVSTDSLDDAEAFEPVQIDLPSVKSALNMYDRHKKISMSRIQGSEAQARVAN